MQRILIKILLFICVVQIANSSENNKLAKPETDSTPTRYFKNFLHGVVQVSFAVGVFGFICFALFFASTDNFLDGGLESVKKELFQVPGSLMSKMFGYLGKTETYSAIFISVFGVGVLLRSVWSEAPSKEIRAILPGKPDKDRHCGIQDPSSNCNEAEKQDTENEPPKKDPKLTTTPGNVSPEAVASSQDHKELTESHTELPEDPVYCRQNSDPPQSQSSNCAAFIAIGIASVFGVGIVACMYYKFCQKPTASVGSDVENVKTPKNIAGPDNEISKEIIV